MTLENPGKKILERIKAQKIKPASRLKLNWKSYVFWAVWGLTAALGALFVSFIILNLLDIHPDIFRYLGIGRIFFVLLLTAPLLWIILALLALVSGFLALRHTKHGYRYSVLFATSLGVLIVSVLGFMFHLADVHRRVGEGFFGDGPMHRGLAFPIERRWQRPGDGLLGGEIVEVGKNMFILKAFDDQLWEVSYTQDTKIRIREGLKAQERVEVIGKKTDDGKFAAEFIGQFPFERMGPHRGMGGPGNMRPNMDTRPMQRRLFPDIQR